jgi:hypothetical protein
LTKSLRAFRAGSREDVFDKAMARIPEEHKKYFEKALTRASRRKGDRAQRMQEPLQWSNALEHRISFAAKPSVEEERHFGDQKKDDARRIRKKFPAVHTAAEQGDTTWRSALSNKFSEWCRNGAWVQCEVCKRLEKRSFEPVDVEGKRRSCTIKKCKHCKDKTGYPTVTPEDIPIELRNLPKDVMWVLRPLEPFCGKFARAQNGYRVHTDMTRFWWRPIPVTTQIELLEDRKQRRLARRTYDFLMAREESSYKKFVDMHEQFLTKHQNVLTGLSDDMQLQLPRRCIEEVGLECAVWPHLYSRTNMCETHVRFSDTRRKVRRTRKQNAKNRDSSDSDSDTSSSEDSSSSDNDDGGHLNFAREGRNSAKASYIAKVLGPVLGYGSDYELFQFVYDLWLWSSLGAKKNQVNMPIHLAMGGHSFTPEFWRMRHDALIDLVKQLGLPTLFITCAPYEWGMPYAQWIEDEMEKLLRTRLHLPVAETLHIAHVLGQAVVGLLTGANRQSGISSDKNARKKRGWTKHVFSAKDQSGKTTVVNFFARLEFQDGKRRRYINMEEAATQYYHGRGTVHVHMLLWLENEDTIGLEKVISATAPEDNEPLRDLVEGSQRSYTGSGWPVHEGESKYDYTTPNQTIASTIRKAMLKASARASKMV